MLDFDHYTLSSYRDMPIVVCPACGRRAALASNAQRMTDTFIHEIEINEISYLRTYEMWATTCVLPTAKDAYNVIAANSRGKLLTYTTFSFARALRKARRYPGGWRLWRLRGTQRQLIAWSSNAFYLKTGVRNGS